MMLLQPDAVMLIVKFFIVNWILSMVVCRRLPRYVGFVVHRVVFSNDDFIPPQTEGSD